MYGEELRTAVMFIYLLTLSYFDLREKKVPCVLLAAGGLAAALWSAASCIWGVMDWREICRGMLPGGLLLLVAVLTRKAGKADGIVLLLAGAAEGFQRGLLLLCISLFLLAFCSVILILLRKVNGNSKIPYLPFVCISYMLLQLSGS